MIVGAAGNSGVLTTLVATILGGGFIGGIVAYRKLKPESDQIIVSSAKDVVLIQKGALDDLRAQMAAMEARFEAQTAASALAVAECHAEREELRAQRDAGRVENSELRARVEALEAEVAQLRHRSNRKEPS